MQKQEALREIAALRHNFHINSRLRLEFLASLSKMFREHSVPANDELLSSLVLAIPDELSADAGRSNGNGKSYSTENPMPVEPEPPTEPIPPTEPEPPTEPIPPTEP